MRLVCSTVCLMLLVATRIDAQQNSLQLGPVEKHGQDRNYDLQPGVDPDNRLFSPFLKHIADDQKHFWTLPSHLRTKDLKWILPVASATAGLIASDSWISKQVPNRPYQLNRSLKVSDYSL